MPRKPSAVKKTKSKRNLLKKKGSIKRRKSRVSHGRNSTRITRKQTEIFNKFIVYLKTEKKEDYIISSKDVYDCVTNPKNNNYSVVKDAIIKFIITEQLDKKPDDFDTSNAIAERLSALVPFDCDDESSSS